MKTDLISADDENTLFREETPGTKAFSVFSRMVGLPYLWNTFAYPIAELEVANNVRRISPPILIRMSPGTDHQHGHGRLSPIHPGRTSATAIPRPSAPSSPSPALSR